MCVYPLASKVCTRACDKSADSTRFHAGRGHKLPGFPSLQFTGRLSHHLAVPDPYIPRCVIEILGKILHSSFPRGSVSYHLLQQGMARPSLALVVLTIDFMISYNYFYNQFSNFYPRHSAMADRLKKRVAFKREDSLS